jgi:TPR repeat protein
MSYGELARTLLCYFEQSDPYLPIHPIPDSTNSIDELLREAAACQEDERYEQAIPYWEQAANRGSAEAQYYLWRMHTEGWGGLEDFNVGLSFLRKAADQGYGKAELELAECHADEIIGGKSYAEEAIYWGTRAFEHGFVEAAKIVANMYAVERPGVKKDDALAFSWFRKAAEAGDAYAQYQVGVSYEHGLGVEKSKEDACNWYKKARITGYELPKECTSDDPIGLAEAKQLANEHLCAKDRRGATVEAREMPPPGAYGFDPEGWATFCVIEKYALKVGGDEYIAVNLTTGQVRSLGIIGD